MGIGLAVPYASAPRLALSALSPAQAGQGSGIVNACTFLGGSTKKFWSALRLPIRPRSFLNARRTEKCVSRQALGMGRRSFCAIRCSKVRNVEGRLHIGRKPQHHDEWNPPIEHGVAIKLQ
jgi:hypothetical protein